MAEVLDTAFAADFPSDEFRDAITNTMIMGLPNKESEEVEFSWAKDVTYTIQDSDNKPYSLSTSASTPVTDDTPDPVKISVAVEYIHRAPDGTPLGEFDNPRAVLTILDVEYEKVRGADYVTLGGNKYMISYVLVEALFDVDVYTLQATALEES